MVLVILAMTAALGVMGVDGYIDRAKQNARDSVARTIFMAAQTSLTHAYNQDRDYYTNNHSPDIPPPYDFLPESEQDKQTHTPKALVYLTIDPSAARAGQPLYEMLAPYINDKSILDGAVLIEFNRETGMMLSAFYSEMPEVTAFSYGAGGYDVRAREKAQLHEGLVGFYGVDGTGEVLRVNPIDTDDYTLRLNDYIDHTREKYGLLTAEIEMPVSVDENLAFAFTLIPQMGEEETVTFSVSGTGADFSLIALSDDRIDDPAQAIASPRVIGARKIPVYLETIADVQRLVFILDGVRSLDATVPIGIRQSFPGVEGGFLSATLTLSDGADSAVVYSENDDSTPVHAFYGGDSNVERLTVRSVRHLNNVRYCEDERHFSQMQSIYMTDYQLQPINFTPISNRLDTWETADGKKHFGFGGTYESNPAYAIYDLHIDLTGQSIPSSPDEDDRTLYNAGLFDTVLHGGSVKNVRFATTKPVYNDGPVAYSMLRVLQFANDTEKTISDSIASVKGIDYAGGIAAVNEGTIENCTMTGYVSADYADSNDGVAGGIVGRNSNGSIRRCASACTVSANRYAGGIAGQSDGSISFCEAGTAGWRDATDSTRLFLSGIAAYGAADGASVYRADHTVNNTFRVKIERSNGGAGGIVGNLSGTSATVTGCVNACKVESGNLASDGTGAHEGGMAGGIAGLLNVNDTAYSAVRYSYNAGAVYATDSAGGVVGEVLRGQVSYCYNTGYVNREYESVRQYSYDTAYCLPGITRNLTNSVNHSGGLLGTGSDDTVIRDCYSMQYTGDQYGGAFGVLSDEAIVENCAFQLNVLNTTADYYTSDRKRDVKNAATNQLAILGVENLRKAPSEGNLGANFTDGSFISPVGTFGFKFPRLTTTGDGDALLPHRTPWNTALERYGEIRFTKGNLKNQGQEIYATFYLAPPSGRIVLRLNSKIETHRNMTVIPLLDTSGYNSLGDCRRVPGKWFEIYGYSSDSAFDDDHRNYTLQIRATKLVATDPDDAVQIAKGYTFRYDLRMYYASWDEPDPKYHTPIYSDVTIAVAELYNTHKSSSNGYVDEDTLGGEDALSIIDPSVPGLLVQARALQMNINNAARHTVRITFMYQDKTTQVIYLHNNDLNGDVATSYRETMLNSRYYRKCRTGFATDGVGFNTTDDWLFPFYVSDEQVHLVLWTQYRSAIFGDGHVRTYPNGLGESFPVNVKVELLSGNGVEETYVKTFRNWRTVQ